MDTDAKPSRRGLYIGIAVVVVFLAIVAGSVAWALSRSGSGGTDPAATAAAYRSAMLKAGVTAEYPAEPVQLEDVIPGGAHPFAATFTADELAALLSTFRHEVVVDGTRVELLSTSMAFPEAGVARLSTQVAVQDSIYSAMMLAPVSFENGRISSPGATKATAEGFSLSEARRAQLTDGVIIYANEYLASAPGLTVDSAKITADGLVVTGTAPDTLEFR